MSNGYDCANGRPFPGISQRMLLLCSALSGQGVCRLEPPESVGLGTQLGGRGASRLGVHGKVLSDRNPPCIRRMYKPLQGGATAGFSATVHMPVARCGYRPPLGISRDATSRKIAPPEQYSGYLLVGPCNTSKPQKRSAAKPQIPDIRPVAIRTAVGPRSLPVIQTLHFPLLRGPAFSEYF